MNIEDVVGFVTTWLADILSEPWVHCLEHTTELITFTKISCRLTLPTILCKAPIIAPWTCLLCLSILQSPWKALQIETTNRYWPEVA